MVYAAATESTLRYLEQFFERLVKARGMVAFGSSEGRSSAVKQAIGFGMAC